MKRCLLLLVAIFQILAFGGAVYGWPSLRLVFERCGVLADRCRGNDCSERDLAFGLAFTFGSMSVQGGRVFIGIFLDAFGPRVTVAACCLAVSSSYLLFTAVLDGAGLPALCAAMAFCGMGSGCQMGVQSVSELFPGRKFLVLGLLSMAFQVSTVAWALVQGLTTFGIEAHTVFQCIALAAFVYAAVAFQVWPQQPFTSASRPSTILKFREQLTSPDYRACVLWYSVLLIGTQFTIASVNDQMYMKTNKREAEFLITAFMVCMGVCGGGAPVTGFVIDSIGFARVSAAITLGFVIIYLFLLSSSIVLQIVAFGMHAAFRVSLFAFYFSYVSGTFGFRYFGKLAGIGLLVSATCSLALYPMLRMSFALGSFSYANLLLLATALAALLFPLRLLRDEQRRSSPPTSLRKKEDLVSPEVVQVFEPSKCWFKYPELWSFPSAACSAQKPTREARGFGPACPAWTATRVIGASKDDSP